MEWKFENGMPIYSQIVDQLSMQIASGAYAPGAKLPSVRDLAAEAGVNPNTMQRALGELERKMLVFSERTSGRYVTKEEGVVMELRKTLASKYVEELFENLSKIGMTKEEICKIVAEWEGGQK